MRGAFAYHFVLQPLLAFAIGIAGVTLQPLPVLDAVTLMIHRGLLSLALTQWRRGNNPTDVKCEPGGLAVQDL